MLKVKAQRYLDPVIELENIGDKIFIRVFDTETGVWNTLADTNGPGGKLLIEMLRGMVERVERDTEKAIKRRLTKALEGVFRKSK